MKAIKYTVEVLAPIVAKSVSMAEVLRHLGLKQAGGNQSYIKRLVSVYGLDRSHFHRVIHNKGKSSHNRSRWEDVLVYHRHEHSRRESVIVLRNAMKKYGFEEKCEVCNMPPIWQGKPLRLQIDHKNGDFCDNRPENVRFICPNCHSQTENFGSKNKKMDGLVAER